MKKIKIRDRKIWSHAGKILIGLVLVSMVGGLSPLPAFGQGRRGGGPHDRDRFERRDRDRGSGWLLPPAGISRLSTLTSWLWAAYGVY